MTRKCGCLVIEKARVPAVLTACKQTEKLSFISCNLKRLCIGHCIVKMTFVNRNTTPKVKFFSLICRTQMLKGDAGVNVHCRSVFAAVLNRAVHSRRLQGSL